MSTLPPTAPEGLSPSKARRSRALRRGALVVLAAFVALGAFGLFGIRTKTVTASGGGYDLSLDYPWTERSGQPLHWVLTIHRAGGFPDKVNVAIEQSYLDLIDLNDIQPDPESTTTRGNFVVWTYDPPPGDFLRISIDAIIQTNAHFGAGAVVAILEDGRPVVSLRYHTWVAP